MEIIIILLLMIILLQLLIVDLMVIVISVIFGCKNNLDIDVELNLNEKLNPTLGQLLLKMNCNPCIPF